MSLDIECYPHVVDSIVAASDWNTRLSWRQTCRALLDILDPQIFFHVAVYFHNTDVVARTPDQQGKRLPLPPFPRAGNISGPIVAGLVKRWHRALSSTQVVDLHGSINRLSSAAIYTPASKVAHNALLTRLATIHIPVVREARVGSGHCPFAAVQWHTYVERSNPFPLPPNNRTNTFVVHLPWLKTTLLREYYPFVVYNHSTPIRRGPQLLPQNGDLFIVLHLEGIESKNGDEPFVATTRWRDIKGGCRLLSAVSSVLVESDMRLIVVGWDVLPEMVVTETGISSTGILQDETNTTVPSAGRALLRDLAADYPRLASLGGDRWENRISWLALNTWRNQSRLPSVIATAPCSLAPLSSATYDYGCPREALPTGTDINTDHTQQEGCASSSPVLDSSSSQHPSVIANAEQEKEEANKEHHHHKEEVQRHVTNHTFAAPDTRLNPSRSDSAKADM